MSLTSADAAAFALTIASGGVAVFPADTVYGLAAAPSDLAAVARLYELKGRAPSKPAALMFFDRERALAELPQLGARTRAALERLLPGGVTLLLPDPDDPVAALGLRVPRLEGPLAALAEVELPVLQSSANHAGGADPTTLAEVPEAIRSGADLVLDGGPLPGTSSTVIDLRGYERDGRWKIVREGAVPVATVTDALG
ncbi:Sua5/YciO/YrdC/YwlC family protein [Conexibacter stalactiti]|uniref:L-threonylcarbamoyladenylate synthase n=1 Tax=Conexibacter stalactiti TaxID=1940611 RepID=A0ABU4HTJ8_9ACTN|nr:Sua5/YciO/YrdC/YwlC family protein [Conexibacter stalactiti]MDW5596642.1 Sua5/YciO/YrdC/YwlC family protein [Conexibacter stalactiti]MEC5037284.1 Sua5/YciO/YrdC/YwlC family protein [Conexibacter stalactiti]